MLTMPGSNCKECQVDAGIALNLADDESLQTERRTTAGHVESGSANGPNSQDHDLIGQRVAATLTISDNPNPTTPCL
jgi:hypothetical protein